jgi:RNA polymerase sigma-70 factor (ECF subfamily)
MISARDVASFDPADERLASFAEHRPLLFSIAYRMLGSTADAEDVLQDAYLRWQRAKDTEVRSPKDYLCTTVTRLAVDHLQSARVRREVYVGPWLPDPLVGVDAHDPLAASTLAESLSTAFLVLLERLTPTQRAAFLLREAFAFDYAEVARILRTTEANVRQLVQRSKQHLASGRPRFASDSTRADELTRRFLTACTTGDVNSLLTMLADNAVAWADGGGKFAAARRPVTGSDRVARFVASLVTKWTASGEVSIEAVSGGAGLSFRVGGQLRAVLTLATNAAGRVQRVFIQVNPDKLHDSKGR